MIHLGTFVHFEDNIFGMFLSYPAHLPKTFVNAGQTNRQTNKQTHTNYKKQKKGTHQEKNTRNLTKHT